MKKLLSLTTVLLLSIEVVYGAPVHSSHSEVKFGIQLKPHFSGIMLSDEDGFAYSISAFRPSLGLFGEYAFSDIIGGRVSLEYSGQGWYTGVKSENLHYIMFTAIPRFYMNADRQFCVFIGPRLSWLAFAKSQDYVNGEKEGGAEDLLDEKVPEDEKPKRVNFGILLGIDYEFNNGILLGSEANLGLTNIGKSDDDFFIPISAGFTLGYNFAKLF